MFKSRWRSRLGVVAFMALLIAWGVASVTLRSDRKIPTFRIEFGDAAFIVDRDWVMPSDRANNFDQYEVLVPLTRVTEAVRTMMLAQDIEIRRNRISPREVLNHTISYSANLKPGEQFSKLLEVDGWIRLPDTNPDFRVAVQDDSRPYATPRSEAYEVKADPRFVIFCGAYFLNEPSRAWKGCSLTVPYRSECVTDKCTKISFRLAPSQMTRWAQIAEEFRGVMRPFEVKPDLKYWQEREQIYRPLVPPLVDSNSNQVK